MNNTVLSEKSVVIDLHNDSIMGHIWRGGLSLVCPEGRTSEEQRGTIAFLRGDPKSTCLSTSEVQLNIPMMGEAGIDAAFFALDVTLAVKNWLTASLDGIGYLLSDIEQHEGAVRIVRTSEDIIAAKQAGQAAVVLAIENSDCVERSLNVLRVLRDIGVRSIGLTHNVSSWAADGCYEARDGAGLTHFGQRLVREMNRLGMIVDLAHVSSSAFFDTLDVTDKPVINSHACARALCDDPRNLTDEQLRALAANKGVVGVTLWPPCVAHEGASFERFLQHIEHIAAVAGVDSVGIGSDFDGGGTLLDNAREFPRIGEGLMQRGFSEDDTRLVLGGNVMRVLAEVMG